MANETMGFMTTTDFKPPRAVEPSITFDPDEMERLCKAPSYEVPDGLTTQELLAWIKDLAESA